MNAPNLNQPNNDRPLFRAWLTQNYKSLGEAFCGWYGHSIGEDILQETVIAALKWDADGRFGNIPPKAWRACLWTIAWRTAKKLRPRPHLPIDANHPCLAINPFEQLEEWEAIATMSQAARDMVDEFPPELKEAFECFFDCGFTYCESAEYLGIPFGRFAGRIVRIRQRLRAALGCQVEENLWDC